MKESGKNIQGRPGFQQMLDDIVDRKDGISFVICFKLSRFGRKTADILNSLKLMKRYGVHLICVKENIDSSLDSGKMMISILGAMAEIERDNISIQTMAGRREKARQGGWNGAKPPYPTYYSYACRSDVHNNGIKCGFGQISCGIIDKAMSSIISQIINADNFGEIMAKLVNDQIDTTEVEKELDTAAKANRQALGLQRKLESELDKLDVMDKHPDRKYESLSRRLDDVFEAIEAAEKQISDCEARMESIKRQQLTRESVCESLKIFDKFFDKMSDYEKKAFVNTFIKSIEIYPYKSRKNGCPIKAVHFRFPVAYSGETVYEFSPPSSTTDENVALVVKG